MTSPADPASSLGRVGGGLRIGLGVFTLQAPARLSTSSEEEVDAMLSLASAAEAVGFDSVWVSEHHGVDDGYLPSLPIALSAIAAVTGRVRLGMAVALAPFQHPVRFAEECAVIQNLSAGRLIVGLGLGWRRAEFVSFGVPRVERVARLVDLVEFCRLAWSGSEFNFVGRHLAGSDLRITPSPETPIPLMLGGTADGALRRAGDLADGLITSAGHSPDRFLRQVDLFDRAASAAGRTPLPLPVGLHLNTWVSRDGTVPEDVRRSMRYHLGKYEWLHREDDAVQPLGSPDVPEETLWTRSLTGVPDELVDSLGRFVAPLAPNREIHLIVKLHYPGLDAGLSLEAVRLFGEEVIAPLKAKASK